VLWSPSPLYNDAVRQGSTSRLLGWVSPIRTRVKGSLGQLVEINTNKSLNRALATLVGGSLTIGAHLLAQPGFTKPVGTGPV